MRPLHHKIAHKSWLFTSYFFRNLMGILFLLSSGFALGQIIKITAVLDKQRYIALGMTIVISFILWIMFFRAHQKQKNREAANTLIEYLEELKNKSVISEEDFLREREIILKQ